jgi:hypothetical protein
MGRGKMKDCGVPPFSHKWIAMDALVGNIDAPCFYPGHIRATGRCRQARAL